MAEYIDTEFDAAEDEQTATIVYEDDDGAEQRVTASRPVDGESAYELDDPDAAVPGVVRRRLGQLNPEGIGQGEPVAEPEGPDEGDSPAEDEGDSPAEDEGGESA